MKKLISVILAGVMMLSLGTTTFASNTNPDHYVTAYAMSAEETAKMFDTRAMTRTGTVLLAQNTTGHQGVACAMFTADEENVSFRFTSAPSATTYNIILHEGSVYNQGTQVVAPSLSVPINNGTSFSDLNIGTTYYFVVSSDDVAGATTARYEIKTFA